MPMTLEGTMMKNLSEWRPQERSSCTITTPENQWTIHLTADRCDELGSQVWELCVRRKESPADQNNSDWANRIAERTRGLVDRFKVLEVDNTRHEALIRSENPVQRDDKVLYYEIHLKGNSEATLRRFQAATDSKGKREQVAFLLMHEATVSVVDALIG